MPIIRSATAIAIFLLSSAIAQAKCTTEQYVEFGRKGMSDAEIAKKCAENIPAWLNGKWHVTLKREDYKVEDINKDVPRSGGFNPMLEGMKKFAEIADTPDEKREELWIISVGDGKFTANRLYDAKHNPGSTRMPSMPFPMMGGNQQPKAPQPNKGHKVTGSKIENNHLIVEMTSPAFGKHGVEEWSFNIDLAGYRGNKNQLMGSYKMRRDVLSEGKMYIHSGKTYLMRQH